MFDQFKTFETTYCGRPFVVETGKMAGLANGSCLVRYGETVVLATATMSREPRPGIDFFPLSIDFEEKLYAVGKIPGSFLKREGRPSEKAILASRLIDRPMRPLFPKDMRNDVSIVITVMSVDPDCAPDITGMCAASLAVAISDIPWNGPIAGAVAGLIDGEIVINPTAEQRAKSEMAVTVATTEKKVVMLEAGANQVPDEIVFDGIMKAQAEAQKMVEFIKGVAAEIGKPKKEFESKAVPAEIFEDVKAFCEDRVKVALDNNDKTVRDAGINAIADDMQEHFAEKYPESEEVLAEALYQLQKKVVRHWLLDEGKRCDGRGMMDIRPLAAEVSLLPRTHGSGLFTRGQTQVLSVATLGLIAERQLLDGIDEEVVRQSGRRGGQEDHRVDRLRADHRRDQSRKGHPDHRDRRRCGVRARPRGAGAHQQARQAPGK